MTKRDLGGRLALLLAAMIWGSAFFVMKNAVDSIPTWMLLGIRFTMGAGVLALIFWKRLKLIRASTWARGAALGVLLCAAYGVQTFGLMDTTPGKNAFLTTVYCILVPFLNWALLGRRPTVCNGLAAVLCLGGIGLVSLTEGFTVGRGDLLTLVSGVIYAAHMIALARFSQGEDTALLTLIQFMAAALMAWLLSLATETPPDALPAGAVGELIYLGRFLHGPCPADAKCGTKKHAARSRGHFTEPGERVRRAVLGVVLWGSGHAPAGGGVCVDFPGRAHQ